MTTFGDLFKLIRNGRNVTQDKSGVGLAVSRIETISSGTVDFSRTGHTNEIVPDDSFVEPGDLLFSHINSPTHVGKVALYEGPSGRLVHGINLLLLRCDRSRIDPRYALYLIRSPLFRASLLPFVNRAVNQASVSISNLRSIAIEVPSLDRQRSIVAVLDQAQALRAKRHASFALLDELTESVFLSMFGDRRVNPRGWPVAPLGEIAQFYAGGTLPTGEPWVGQSGGYFLAKVSDLNLEGNERLLLRANSWSEVSGARSATCPEGSIVIPKRGGAIGTNKKRLTTRPTSLDPNLMAITPSAQIDLVWLFQWFLSFDLLDLVSGSSVPQLNKQDLAPLRIPIPPLSMQREFAHKAAAVGAARQPAGVAALDLETLVGSLQHRAFAGSL